MTKLFTLADSEAVGGFYQSDIYCAADTLEAAKGKIRAAFAIWLTNPSTGGFYRDTAQLPYYDEADNREAKAKRRVLIAQFEKELERVCEVEGAVKICHMI